MLHTNAKKLPLGFLVSFVTFSGVSSDESIESQSGTLSRIGDVLGPLEKATASPAVLRLQNFYQRNTPWVMPRMEACHCLSFVVFFSVENNNQKKQRKSVGIYCSPNDAKF